MAAPTLPRLVPTAYSSTTGTAYTTTTVGNIDNGVATPDGAFIVAGANSTATIFYAITDMPADFLGMLTCTYNIRYKIETLTNDTETLSVRIYKSDKSTPLTDPMLVVSTTANISITNKGDTSFTTVVKGTKADWDGAFLGIITTHNAYKGADDSVWSIDEVEINGTYEAPATVALSSPSNHATGQSTTPQLIFTGTDPNASDTLEYEIQVDTVNTFNSTPGASFNLKYLEIDIEKNNSPTDNVSLEIRSDSCSGTLLGTSDAVSYLNIGSSFGFVRFTFATPITLTNGVKYYIVIQRSGAYNVSNYYTIAGSVNTYTLGEAYRDDAGVWSLRAGNGDFAFKTYDENGNLINSNIGEDISNIIYGVGGAIYDKMGQSFTVDCYGPLLDKSSDTESPTHFLDYPDEGDTHPFTNNTAVAYTPAAGILSNSTQYFWRVRAKDSGSGTWGAWSDIWDFETEAGTTTTTTTATPTTTTTTTSTSTTTTTTTKAPYIPRMIIF